MPAPVLEGVYINLERAPERRAAMQAQLQALGLPYRIERFAAVDGSAAGACPEGLSPGQYGCWLSHLACLERAARGARHLHVVEDDALLSRKLAAVPEMIAALEAGAAGAWDLVYLDATLVEIADMYQVYDWVRQSREKDIVQVCKVPREFSVYGTLSYVVNSTRAKHVHDFLQPYLRSGWPVDNVFAHGIQTGHLQVYLTAPFLTSGGDASAASSVEQHEASLAARAWFAFRRLCFQDFGEEAAAQLAAAVDELTRDIAPPERIFGALCSFRVAKWGPDLRFPPLRPK